MGEDEEGTLALLKAHRRELVDPKIAAYGGRIVKTTGDGLLIEFPSVVDAARCALDVQEGMRTRNAELPPARRIEFRVGINIGDVISEEGDIFGDGVNIAARLQETAQPGEIILSYGAYEQVRNKIDATISGAGERQLKNIKEPQRTFRLSAAPTGGTGSEPFLPHRSTPPKKWAIAVLPFENFSGEPRLHSLAEGIVEDLLTALSHSRFVHPLSRTLTLSSRQTDLEVRELWRRLGADFALGGSIRTIGTKVRVTGHLTDSRSGLHVWADRYDSEPDHLEALQGELIAKIPAAIEWALLIRGFQDHGPAEPDKLKNALSRLYRFNAGDTAEAVRILELAIAEQPNAHRRHQVLAAAHCSTMLFAWSRQPQATAIEAVRAAERAVALQPRDPYNHSVLGWSLLYIAHHARSEKATRRAVELYPNAAVGWGSLAFTLAFVGKSEEALDAAKRYLEFDADAPLFFAWLFGPALANHNLGRYRACIDCAEKMAQRQPNCPLPHVLLASAYAYLGAPAEARAALGELDRLRPEPVLSWLRPFLPLQVEAHYEQIAGGIAAAGR